MADELPQENNRAVRVLELLKETVGLWHWRHTEMMGDLPREHPVKIQGLSPSLIFAPSNAHLAPSLPLSEVTAEKFQWCPRRLRIIIQVCICIYVCVSKRMIDLMCAQSLCVCGLVHVKITYGRVGGWPLGGLCRRLAGLSDPPLVGRCTLSHPDQAVWCEAISTSASPLWFPLRKRS